MDSFGENMQENGNVQIQKKQEIMEPQNEWVVITEEEKRRTFDLPGADGAGVGNGQNVAANGPEPLERAVSVISGPLVNLITYLDESKNDESDSPEFKEVCESAKVLDTAVKSRASEAIVSGFDRLYDACTVYNSKNRSYRWTIKGKNRQKNIGGMLNFLNRNVPVFDALREKQRRGPADGLVGSEDVTKLIEQTDRAPKIIDYISDEGEKELYSLSKTAEEAERIQGVFKLSPKMKKMQNISDEQVAALSMVYGRNMSHRFLNMKREDGGADSSEMAEIKESLLKYENLLSRGVEATEESAARILEALDVTLLKCRLYYNAKNPKTKEGIARKAEVESTFRRLVEEKAKIRISADMLKNKEQGYESIRSAKELIIAGDLKQRKTLVDSLSQKDQIAAKSLSLRDFQKQMGTYNRGEIDFIHGEMRMKNNSYMDTTELVQTLSVLFDNDTQRTVENRQMKERLQEMAFSVIGEELADVRREISKELGLDRGETVSLPLERTSIAKVVAKINYYGSEMYRFSTYKGEYAKFNTWEYARGILPEEKQRKLKKSDTAIRQDLIRAGAYLGLEENESQYSHHHADKLSSYVMLSDEKYRKKVKAVLSKAGKLGYKNLSLSDHQIDNVAKGNNIAVVDEIFRCLQKLRLYSENLSREEADINFTEEETAPVAALVIAAFSAETEEEYTVRRAELENCVRKIALTKADEQSRGVISEAFMANIPMLSEGGSEGLRKAIDSKVAGVSRWQNAKVWHETKETVCKLESLFDSIAKLSELQEKALRYRTDAILESNLLEQAQKLQDISFDLKTMQEMEDVVKELKNTRYLAGFKEFKKLVDSGYDFVKAQTDFVSRIRMKTEEDEEQQEQPVLEKEENSETYSETDKLVSLKGTEKKITAILRLEESASSLIKEPMDRISKDIIDLKDALALCPIGSISLIDLKIGDTKFKIAQKEDNSLHVVFGKRTIPLISNTMKIVSALESDMIANTKLYGRECVSEIVDNLGTSEANAGNLVRTRNFCIKYLAGVAGKSETFFANVSAVMLKDMVSKVVKDEKEITAVVDKVAQIEKNDYINSQENLELLQRVQQLKKEETVSDISFVEVKKEEKKEGKEWNDKEREVIDLIADMFYSGRTWEYDESSDASGKGKALKRAIANNPSGAARMLCQPDFVSKVLDKLPFDEDVKQDVIESLNDMRRKLSESDAKVIPVMKKIPKEGEPDADEETVKSLTTLIQFGPKALRMAEKAVSGIKSFFGSLFTGSEEKQEQKEEPEEDFLDSLPLEDVQQQINDAVTKTSKSIQEEVEKSVGEIFKVEEKRITGQVNQGKENKKKKLTRKEKIKKETDELNKELEEAAKGDNGQGKFMKTVLCNYFKGVSLMDKCAMIASAIRYSKPIEVKKDEQGIRKEPTMAEMGQFLGGYLKGAGPLLQKMLQGMPVTVMPAELKDAIDDMRSNLAPIPQEIVEAQMQNIVDRSGGKITGLIVKKSLGAASVGQTFLCTIMGPEFGENGKEVVVKLLRPDVRNRMMREKKIMLDCARKTDREEEEKLPVEKRRKGDDWIGGMEGTYLGQLERIEEELDLTIEARNARKGSLYDRGFSTVKAMKVDTSVEATTNSLVLEKAEGETVDKYLKRIDRLQKDLLRPLLKKEEKEGGDEQKKEEKEEDFEISRDLPLEIDDDNFAQFLDAREKITKELETMIMRQHYLVDMSSSWVSEGIFGEGFYHGDLHAGNIMINDDCATLIDFGNATSLTEDQQKQITRMMLAASVGNADIFEQGFNDLLNDAAKAKYTEVRDDIKKEFAEVLKKGDTRASGQRIAVALMRALNRGIELPAAVYNFSQSQLRLQNTIDEINAKIQNLQDTLVAFSKATVKKDQTNYLPGILQKLTKNISVDRSIGKEIINDLAIAIDDKANTAEAYDPLLEKLRTKEAVIAFEAKFDMFSDVARKYVHGVKNPFFEFFDKDCDVVKGLIEKYRNEPAETRQEVLSKEDANHVKMFFHHYGQVVAENSSATAYIGRLRKGASLIREQEDFLDAMSNVIDANKKSSISKIGKMNAYRIMTALNKQEEEEKEAKKEEEKKAREEEERKKAAQKAEE